MIAKNEEPILKRYLVTNTTNWMDYIMADRIEKDAFGNTLCFIGKVLVASFPKELAVGLAAEELITKGETNETLTVA
jgi:hypothetical protein